VPKINVYLPDELAEAVKEAGVPVSAICQRALEQAVRRVTAIRETVLRHPGESDGDTGQAGPDPTERLTHFTERARTTLRLAARDARERHAPEVGTEHLLAGMLTEGGNLAVHVLRAMDIEPDQVRRELAALTAGRTDLAAGGDERRFGVSAAGALELAVTEAIGLGHNYVGCEHLLLGLVAEPDGTAGRVLRALGAEPRLTRRAVSAALAGYVHLRAEGTAAAAPADVGRRLADAVRGQLEPLLRRLERLERQVGLSGPGGGDGTGGEGR
jgi:Clp amino terminal domain, pathogenicity island component